MATCPCLLAIARLFRHYVAMRFPPISPPPDVVVANFGGSAPPVLLAGGENRSYRCGEIVLKAADDDEGTEGLLELESTIPESEEFRFPRPIRSMSGKWVHKGWTAREYAEGRHEKGRFQEQINTCTAFHRAISDFPRPGIFDIPGEKNAWNVADVVTWGEGDIDHHPRIAPVVERLRAVLQPVRASPQLIHGDFGGNLLYAEGLPPAVIDFSPYWRPAGFALGVVVADSLVWDDADDSLIDEVSGVQEWLQLLLRAELRRVLEIDAHWARGRDMMDDIDAHLPAVEAICRRCHGTRLNVSPVREAISTAADSC